MRTLVYHIYTTQDEIIEVRTMKRRDEIIAELREQGLYKDHKDVMMPVDEKGEIIYPTGIRGAKATIKERKKAVAA